MQMSIASPGGVYVVPPDFVHRFESEFPQYRIRWSLKKKCWLIEQHCGRAALSPLRIDAHDDSLIRARDGFWLVMEIQPGDRMSCPRCGNIISVMTRKFGENRCENCIQHKRDGRVVAGFFPFCEGLLEHLRRTDPMRGATARLAKEADAQNQKILEMLRRKTSNTVEAGTKDAFNRIMGIQSVGYTGNNKHIHLSKDFS